MKLILLILCFICISCDDKKQEYGQIGNLSFKIDKQLNQQKSGPDFTLEDFVYKDRNVRIYSGRHPSLLGYMHFILKRFSDERNELISESPFDSLTFLFVSDETSEITRQQLKEGQRDNIPIFDKYYIHYIKRKDFTIWTNLPLEKDKLATEVIVEPLNSKDSFTVFYFDKTTYEDSIMIFDFAKSIEMKKNYP